MLEGFNWNCLQLLGYAPLDVFDSTKMMSFQVGFDSGEQKKTSHGTQGLRNHWNPFFRQKLVDGDGRVKGDVMVEHPSVRNVQSDAKHPFSGPFKDFFIKNLVDSLSLGHKFCVNDPTTVKKKSART